MPYSVGNRIAASTNPLTKPRTLSPVRNAALIMTPRAATAAQADPALRAEPVGPRGAASRVASMAG